LNIFKLIISVTSRWVTLFFATLTLMSVAAYYINPLQIWPLALMGLALPMLCVVMGLLLILWIARRRWFFVVPLIVLIMATPQIRNIMGWRLKVPRYAEVPEAVEIMTYNVRNFDLYNWSNNLRSKAVIYDMILQEDPDIICFQEFYSDSTTAFNNIRQLNEMGYRYFAFAEELTLRRHNQWGIATFSKYPIMSSSKILKSRFKTGYGFMPYKGIVTRIKTKSAEFVLVNTHLQSVHFAEQDYEAIKEAAEDQDMNWLEGRTILGKMVNAFRRRGFQADELAGELKHYKEKLILAGDFNDTPSSYSYRKVRGNLKDAFLEKGRGPGATYNGPVPGLRIDYLLHTEDIGVVSVKVVDNRVSDHRPLIGTFYIPE